jgi:glycosyltransferase involved in cell wall biosynthesis
MLLKSGGKADQRQQVLKSLRQGKVVVKFLSLITRKHPYTFQAWSFAISLMFYLRNEENFILYTGEPIVYKALQQFRKLTKKNFITIFFTGGQVIPADFDARDIVHHVTPMLRTHERAAHLPYDHQFVIPHFIEEHHERELPDKITLRKSLNLPDDKMIVLSVGALDQSVKRMDYVLREVAQLKHRDYFLLLIGEEENETPALKRLAHKLCDENRYEIKSVSSQQVADYYAAADIFVLASLKEGFGLVYIEALAHGLPVVAHAHPTTEYVIRDRGYLLDLTIHGGLAEFLRHIDLQKEQKLREERKKFVQENYSWSTLRQEYLKLFRAAEQALSS